MKARTKGGPVSPDNWDKYRQPLQPLSPAASQAAINWKRELGASGAPSTQLDWALYWIARGIHVFPARHFLGSLLVDNFIKHATIDRARVIDWWSEYPDADICCVPSLSDHHVVAAFADEGGIDSLGDLEDAWGTLPTEFITRDAWGSVYCWRKGPALTSHHALGPGLHVLGEGQRIFLPDSAAPHIVYKGA